MTSWNGQKVPHTQVGASYFGCPSACLSSQGLFRHTSSTPPRVYDLEHARFNLQKKKTKNEKPGVVAYTCNSSTEEREVGGWL